MCQQNKLTEEKLSNSRKSLTNISFTLNNRYASKSDKEKIDYKNIKANKIQSSFIYYKPGQAKKQINRIIKSGINQK